MTSAEHYPAHRCHSSYRCGHAALALPSTPDADTFDAHLWLWSGCPTADNRPLQTMGFVNANAVAVLLDVVNNPLWTNRNVVGTFLYD